MNKNGVISPLVATVLIIGVTVALAGLIMVWGNNFINEHRQELNNQVIEENYVEGTRLKEFTEYINNCRTYGGVIQRQQSIAYGQPPLGNSTIDFLLYDRYQCYGGEFPKIIDYNRFETYYSDKFFREAYILYEQNPDEFMNWYYADETYTVTCKPTFVTKDGEEHLITYCSIDRVQICGDTSCDLTTYLTEQDNINSNYEFYDIKKTEIEITLRKQIERGFEIKWE